MLAMLSALLLHANSPGKRGGCATRLRVGLMVIQSCLYSVKDPRRQYARISQIAAAQGIPVSHMAPNFATAHTDRTPTVISIFFPRVLVQPTTCEWREKLCRRYVSCLLVTSSSDFGHEQRPRRGRLSRSQTVHTLGVNTHPPIVCTSATHLRNLLRLSGRGRKRRILYYQQLLSRPLAIPGGQRFRNCRRHRSLALSRSGSMSTLHWTLRIHCKDGHLCDLTVYLTNAQNVLTTEPLCAVTVPRTGICGDAPDLGTPREANRAAEDRREGFHKFSRLYGVGQRHRR